MSSTHEGMDIEPPDAAASPREGFGTSFGAFRTVELEHYRNVLTSGMIVPDANVFLNLYRYTPEARKDFLKALRALRHLIWIPRQVAIEFWKNRESAVAEAQQTASDTVDSLKAIFLKVETELNTWSNRVSLQPGRLDAEKDQISKAFADLQERILKLGSEHGLDGAENTSSDPILAELEDIFHHNVGPELAPEENVKALQEGARRNRESIPPGYKDKGKTAGNPIGDYILWEQTLREAATKRSDVLIVTNDNKEDWWRKTGGEIQGPRPELHEELRARANVRLFMMRPQTFLKHATELLDLTVSEDTIDQIKRVDGEATIEEQINRLLQSHAQRVSQEFVQYLEQVGSEFIYHLELGDQHGSRLTIRAPEGHEIQLSILFNSEYEREADVTFIKLTELVEKSESGVTFGALFQREPHSSIRKYVEHEGLTAVWPQEASIAFRRDWEGSSRAFTLGLVRRTRGWPLD